MGDLRKYFSVRVTHFSTLYCTCNQKCFEAKWLDCTFYWYSRNLRLQNRLRFSAKAIIMKRD